MSFDDLNVFDKDGNPRGVILPAQARVIAEPGVRLTEKQDAEVRHAYKLFTDACNASGSQYQVQNRELSDGTRLRMERNTGNDRLWVWPVGGEEDEVWFFASPRAVFADSTIFDGVPGVEVSTFRLRKGVGIRLHRPEVFSEKPDGDTALDQQPGNCLWVDMRTGGSEHIISWWADHRLMQPDFDVARFGANWASRKEFWNQSGKNRLYLNGQKLVDVPYFMVVGAGMWKDTDGIEYVRVVCMEFPDDDNSLYTYQFKPSDAGNPGVWVSNVIVIAWVSLRPVVFDMIGEKFSALYTVDGGSTLRLSEIDFATGDVTVIHSGTRTVTGGQTKTTHDGINESAGVGQTYGASTWSGWNPVTQSQDISYIDGYSATQTISSTFALTGDVTTTSRWVQGFGYDATNALCYYEGVLTDRALVSETRNVSASVTGERTITLTAVNSPPGYDSYTRSDEGSVASTGTDIISIRYTRQFSIVQNRLGTQETVFASETTTPFSMNYTFTQEASGSGTAGPTAFTIATGVTPSPGIWQVPAAFTTTRKDATYRYLTEQWVSDWWYVAACDPRSAYLSLAGVRFDLGSAQEGEKIPQTITYKEFRVGVTVSQGASVSKTESDPGTGSFTAPLEAISKTLTGYSVESGFHVEGMPAYKRKTIAAPFLYNLDDAKLSGLAVPTSGAYNGFDYDVCAAYTLSAMPIIRRKKSVCTVVSGLVGNTAYASTAAAEALTFPVPSGGTLLYYPLSWVCGPADEQSVYARFKTDAQWGMAMCKVLWDKEYDATPATKKSIAFSLDVLVESLSEARAWLSSPIYVDTFKVPK